jgi:branched-chain amino acid transport system substrate-binding protein
MKSKLLYVVMVLTVVLASCGPAATQAPDKACEIKMGLLLSLTGDLGDLGQGQLPAEEIAVSEINAAGGPLGCNVVVVSEDDKSNAQGAVAGANKLVFTDGAITLIGLNSTGITSLLDFARTNKVPVLTHYGGTVKLDTEGGDYIFRTVLSDSFAGVASAKFLTDMGFKTAANLYENGESPQSNAVTMKREFEKMGGKVVVDVAFNPGQSSYQAELKTVFDAHPDIVLLAAGQDSGATILKEWYRGNYGGQWLLGSDLSASEFVASVGTEIMKGMYGQTSGDDVSSPSYKRFQTIWQEKTGQSTVYPWASNLYDSFIMEALAIEIGGAATGEAINASMKAVTTGEVQCISYADCVKALREGKTIQYMGVSGPLQFNKYNNVVAPYTMLITEGDHWAVFKFYSADNFKLGD